MKYSYNSIKEILPDLNSNGLLNPIDYRKSGLSLNHIIGCPLDCAYCVRHALGNFDMKTPHILMDDNKAVELLLNHKYFVKDVTPLQLFNRATDPFLPLVKNHTFNVLKLLSDKKIQNTILIITRFKVSDEDAKRLNHFAPLKIAILFTFSGIEDKALEPIDSNIVKESLRTSYKHAKNYRVILSWRPIIPYINDSEQHIRNAVELSKYAHATAFTGLFFRDEMINYFQNNNIKMPYKLTERRKILPENLEDKLINKFFQYGGTNFFRKTSCAISYAYEDSDYNGHYGIKEICDICPQDQICRCKASWMEPTYDQIKQILKYFGTNENKKFEIKKNAIIIDTMKEQDRYYIQHNLKFQTHDIKNPHFVGSHGRGKIGWDTSLKY